MNREQRELDMIGGFCEITGATPDSSRFFLESANWNLELALASFYETFGGGDNAPVLPPFPGERGQGDAPVSHQEIVIESDPEDQDEQEVVQQRREGEIGGVVSSPASTTNPTNASRSRFATISTIRVQESSSDDEEAQTYYAGGSEHSGQQVVGPSRPTHEIITDMFRSLRDQGGVEAISHEPGGRISFSGQGYRLGQSTDDSQVINPAVGRNIGNEQQREVIFRLWRDGFSIDNGDLRSYNDPQEREFLSRIRQGNVPAELFPNNEGGTIHLSLEDRRNENFVPSVARPVPFTGQGHVLGSGQNDLSKNDNEKDIDKGESGSSSAQQPVVASSLRIDIAEPRTTVQIRLPDGDRIQITLNQQHTIGDLRAAIMEQRPEFYAGNFSLMTTFPRRELRDENLTLQDADVLGTSLLLLRN